MLSFNKSFNYHLQSSKLFILNNSYVLKLYIKLLLISVFFFLQNPIIIILFLSDDLLQINLRTIVKESSKLKQGLKTWKLEYCSLLQQLQRSKCKKNKTLLPVLLIKGQRLKSPLILNTSLKFKFINLFLQFNS